MQSKWAQRARLVRRMYGLGLCLEQLVLRLPSLPMLSLSSPSLVLDMWPALLSNRLSPRCAVTLHVIVSQGYIKPGCPLAIYRGLFLRWFHITFNPLVVSSRL
jgi:hypothetical protein